MELSNEMSCKITFLKTFTIKLRRSPNVSKYDCGDNYCGQFWKRNRYLKIIIERARPQYVLENRLAGRGGGGVTSSRNHIFVLENEIISEKLEIGPRPPPALVWLHGAPLGLRGAWGAQGSDSGAGGWTR